MTSSYGHVLERQPALGGRLDSPSNLDTLQAKKNFSVSHLLDLEEAGTWWRRRRTRAWARRAGAYWSRRDSPAAATPRNRTVSEGARARGVCVCLCIPDRGRGRPGWVAGARRAPEGESPERGEVGGSGQRKGRSQTEGRGGLR